MVIPIILPQNHPFYSFGRQSCGGTAVYDCGLVDIICGFSYNLFI